MPLPTGSLRRWSWRRASHPGGAPTALQCHLGLEKHLTLCVLKRLCHREAPSERSRIGQVRIHGRA